ncbi:6-phosphogluconolactonase [Populibacterium corticicola]|uniref:6-phosphogluconolactonase n=1 Tax=Populibacterium corticicola TaxID=1812826 RepID=A0ABW5XCS6_9MICO
MSERLVVVHPTPQILAQAVAVRLLTEILDRQSVSSPVHVALTGGTVGIATLAEAAKSSLVEAIDWSNVHLWWGDERFLPQGDKDRNEVQARDAWLDSLDGLPEENIHFMPRAVDGYTVEQAAADYAQELKAHASEEADVPHFAVVLLGMGPDAHIASLFPHHADAEQNDAPAIPVRNSPKPPPLRVSLTFDAIQSADEVWVIAAGAEKAPAVAQGLAGAPRSEAPVSAAQGRSRTLWLLDAAAATV